MMKQLVATFSSLAKSALSSSKSPAISQFLYMKLVLAILALCALFLSPSARADQLDFSDLAGIAFSSGGGAFLPPQVLLGLRRGQVSPIMQFVTINQMLNRCVAETLTPQITPDIRDPYLVAKKKFEYGLCRIKKCWQNGMLIQMLPLIGSTEGAEQDGNEQLGVLLAQAFQKDPACDGNGGGGFDPNLIQLLTQASNN